MTRVRVLLRAATTAILFVLAVVGVGVPASAEEPFRVPEQVTDQAGALDAGEVSEVQSAVDTLYDEQGFRLWVVFVDDFSGQAATSWGERTASTSDFGDRDVLMAVATQARSYVLNVPQALSSISDSEISELEQASIEPALREENWAGAATAAATGLGKAASTTGSGSAGLWVAVGVILVLVLGAFAFTRLRARRRRADALEAAEQLDGSDPAAFAALPLDVLDERSRALLVETDEAIRASADELSTAVGELGQAAARPFVEALDGARRALAAAFETRQRLDDAIPESPDERRQMLLSIITSCSDADRHLDEKVAEFDEIRNLLIDADSRLDALTRGQVEQTARLDAAAATLTSLAGRYDSSVLAPVANNVDLAKEQLELADASIDEGRDAAAQPVGHQGPVVAAVRTAESALSRARSLLDAVEHADADIEAARSGLDAAMADAEADIASADRLASHGGDRLAAARAAVAEALGRARTRGTQDPLGSMNALVAADAQLDSALAVATQSKEQDDHARARLDRDLASAQAQVRAASEYIGARSGAVKVQARTRLAEAERHVQAAQQLGATDAPRALQHAAAALSLAAQASHLAQADVADWEATQRPRHSGGYGGSSSAGGILTGVLIDSVLRGGFSGGRSYGNRRGGGYGGFGGGPRSFGGSGSSGRIGRSSGGRF
ncbi:MULTISPECIES: TPM domain-containing protein [unclassified Rhodococcus (in: high G+C Gram-positive bacteria)]|uniref:TPM domain-containing protein n=1 Tax=unclassified Rhodococcus (in: high G+C Gram-positive bacteria) TaxID=192944 RepID=UPI001C9BB511|nr:MULTISPECIES: TPM domain-containing protein [unclassified Rhodococcus (in: high G+C Gram-positive bacteria)]MBY6686412.1 TPM domain-containing protein [Rhodococcus sp. BP-288]MBY6693499.1 TPM domain-containing protein [Rhodococcus sp. BP-188]MBY6699904.1 TPM domain-containing protein [Rhodococcus sp. BP-285]MBY6703751.1 TPM domain-containing protein [Rhodococcus sp. BP-283]MBY6708448.1 TPM domain-containing protein [Rhodococcus sp. BP-241]